MRERFADHLAESEHRIEAALQDAVGTLSLMAEAVRAPSGESIEAITAAAVRLRSSSLSGDAALVIVSAREAPVAGDLRLLMTLIQLAQHQALIANQFELISEQLASIPAGVADRQGTAPQLARMAALASSLLDKAVGRSRRASWLPPTRSSPTTTRSISSTSRSSRPRSILKGLPASASGLTGTC